jgi:SNF2 family DNA or RNA helicase
VVLWPEGEKLRVTREASFDKLRLKIRSRADWFEMSGELALDDALVVDMKRLLELMQTTNSRFIPLGEGQFLALTRELTKRLKELEAFSDKRGKAIGLHPLAALAIEDFTESLPHLDADRGWKTKLEQMHAAMDITPAVPSTLKAELRDYQEEGYTWLARLAHMGFGACLADDMGLGKTIQALGIILARAPMGPTLVVAPTSVCMNWIDEAKRFAPTLRTVVFGGNQRESLVKGLEAHDVLICSYGLLHQESDLMGSIEWITIVLDEAQAIKNVMTKRSQAAMGLKGAFKVITTGTPIENHLGEFWTLFNFINPGLLGSYNKFNERYAVPIEKYNDRDSRKRLKKLISPFILRRTKAQVLDELPPRTEVTLQVEMSPEESAFYEALRQQAIRKLEEDDAPVYQKHLKILAEIMKLRRAACNPRLVMPDTPIPSAKLELFGEVIGELLENRHKALVFSQFVGHLKLIREYLDGKRIDYRYLDGSTPPKERKREVDAFQAGRGDLFLISLKAGGLGLNLTAADYVIHMDPWWNPAVEDQASDRAHRIGQQHPVTVYRLVAQHTIEEKIVKLHQDKRDLAGSLLDGTDISGKISADELLRLIREQ